MKKLLLGVLVFFAMSNFAFAKDTTFATISKTDTQFLFKDKNIKVIALNENELKNTKGAWGWWSAAVNIAIYTVRHYHHWKLRQALLNGFIGLVNPIDWTNKNAPIYLGKYLWFIK